MITVNPVMERLRQGECALGVGIRQARSVDIARIMLAVGYDWLFLDLEHGSMSIDTVAQIAGAALGTGIAPIVRVPGKEPSHCVRALDAGAQGVVVPHVDSAEEAASVVQACRFPPLGQRSVSYVSPHTGYAAMPLAEVVAGLNRETLVAVMLETERAIVDCEAIAAQDGIDVLMVGTQDLALSMGLPGQVGHRRVREAVAAVAAACRRHGRTCGVGGAYEPALLAEFVTLGARFLQTGNDTALLMESARARVLDVQAAVAAHAPARRAAAGAGVPP